MKRSQTTTVFDFETTPKINAIGRGYYDKGWAQNLRCFFDYELIFMLDGQVTYIEDGEEIQVQAGEVAFLSPYAINSSLPLSGAARTIFLHFRTSAPPKVMNRDAWHRIMKRVMDKHIADPKGNSTLLRSPIGLCRRMSPGNQWDPMIPLLEAAIQERQSFSAFGNLTASLYVAQVLLLLSRSLLEGGGEPLFRKENSPSMQLIRKADSIIQHRCSEGLNVEDLARSLEVTPQYLIRTFQEHCAETPLTRIHRVRLSKAQELLKHTTLSIKEIGTMVGMQKVNHFCRFFRKQVGVSPGKWRDQF